MKLFEFQSSDGRWLLFYDTETRQVLCPGVARTDEDKSSKNWAFRDYASHLARMMTMSQWVKFSTRLPTEATEETIAVPTIFRPDTGWVLTDWQGELCLMCHVSQEGMGVMQDEEGSFYRPGENTYPDRWMELPRP